MSVAQDIVRTYRAPRRVFRRRTAPPQSEARAFMVLMCGCLLMFVAQWPRLSRQAHETPDVPFEAFLGAALLGWLFMMPLMLYVFAALSRLVARLLGGTGTWYEARIALFWAVLAAAPLWLLNGLVAGFVGPGPALVITGLAATAAFLVFWLLGLIEAETGGEGV